MINYLACSIRTLAGDSSYPDFFIVDTRAVQSDSMITLSFPGLSKLLKLKRHAYISALRASCTCSILLAPCFSFSQNAPILMPILVVY
jgi:hypothetical protein